VIDGERIYNIEKSKEVDILIDDVVCEMI